MDETFLLKPRHRWDKRFHEKVKGVTSECNDWVKLSSDITSGCGKD